MKILNFPDLQTSSVEIERVCDRADESVLETAAVSVAPPDGGPELLVMFVVLKKGYDHQPEKLKMIFSKAIQVNLNPLFKVSLFDVLISSHYSLGMKFWQLSKQHCINQSECLESKVETKESFHLYEKE